MNFLYFATVALIALSVAGALWVVGRQAVRRLLSRKLVKQAEEVKQRLQAAREADYAGLEKLLFEMRDSFDTQVIEEQLQGHLGDASSHAASELTRAFELMGLTERYLAEVRHARAWKARAGAARMLGALREPRAVGPLVEAMRDEQEDPDVKFACAEALGQLRDPSIIPTLCEELSLVDEWSSPRLAQVLTSFGSAAVDPLLTTLASAKSINARVWAAQVLGKLGDDRAALPLIERLYDRSEQLRLSVANALGDIGYSRAVRPLTEVILRDPVPAVRAQAASSLGRIGDASALPLLVSALGDAEYWMRFRALEAIEALAPEDASPIEGALKDRNPEVRRRAALALERLGKLEQPFADLASDDDFRVEAARGRLIAVGRAGLSERLARHLTDDDPRVRARVASILGPVGDPSLANDLVGAVADPNPQVRACAIESLGDLAKEGTAQSLVPLVGEGDERERNMAVLALRRYPAEQLESMVEELSELATREQDDIRLAAIRVLACAGGRVADQALAQALRDGFSEVRFEAIKALGERGDQSFVAFVGQGLADPSEKVRVAAADALGAIGGQSAVELLLSRMPQADPGQRESICATLAALGFDAVRPVLDVLLASEELNVRVGVIWTLGKTRDPRAAELLSLLMRDEEPRLRASVAGALAKIPCDTSAQALLATLTDPSPYVRSASVNALGAVGDVHHIDSVMELLVDPDLFVRNRATVALARLGGERAFEAVTQIAQGAVGPSFRVIALGVCGTPAGVGEAVRVMEDPQVRRAVNKQLSKEDPATRQRFLANLHIESKLREPAETADASSPSIEPSALLREYSDSLRNSQEPYVRETAAAALANMRDEQALTALADALRHDPDPAVRLRAAQGILAAGVPAPARSALFTATRDPSPEVRVVGIRAVGQHGDISDAEPIFDALRSNSSLVVAAAEKALATLCEGHIDYLHDWMMAQTADRLLISGLSIVACLADVGSLGLLGALARSELPQIRVAASQALAALDAPEATRVMLTLLGDPVEEVRAGVVRALAGSTRSDVLAGLVKMCVDPAIQVRLALCATLATLNHSKALELLERLAEDNSPEVTARAIRGLLSCDDTDGQWRFLKVWPEVPAAAQRMVLQDVDDVRARLAKQLETNFDPQLREVAIQVLAALGATVNAHVIRRGLKDPDAAVRLRAVETLVVLDPELVGAWLREVENDPVPAVRAAAKPTMH